MKRILFFTILLVAAYLFSSCSSANAKPNGLEQQYSDYGVVSNKNLATLISDVKINLSHNYKLVGGICVSNGVYYQAVAK